MYFVHRDAVFSHEGSCSTYGIKIGEKHTQKRMADSSYVVNCLKESNFVMAIFIREHDWQNSSGAFVHALALKG